MCCSQFGIERVGKVTFPMDRDSTAGLGMGNDIATGPGPAIANRLPSSMMESKEALRSMLDTKLSLITLIWSIIHKNSNHGALPFLNHNGNDNDNDSGGHSDCPSLLPLLQTLDALHHQMPRRPQLHNDRHLQILFNSLRDRTKRLHRLLTAKTTAAETH